MRHALLVAAGAFFLAAPAAYSDPVAKDGFDAPAMRLAAATVEGGTQLQVMTYNVKGLPWPVTSDRKIELAAIGDRLRTMRARGDAPDVVVLQEAFTDEARAIAARAGYAHIAYGPTADEVVEGDPGKPMPDLYRWRGEGLGAYISSGLVLMSNHPILATRRIAFPRNACAGYDCLSNKGVLLARIAVPGVAVPVEIVTAHMNSRLPTRTPVPHANEAFVRQMAALDRFIAANADPRSPMIFGGDLNIDSEPRRIATLRQSDARWRKVSDETADNAIFAICARPILPCRPGIGIDAIVKKKRNNDWQLSFSGSQVAVQPVSAAIRFMPDSDGRVLSDHQAVLVSYRLSPSAAKVGATAS